jgi:hypothetical protein
VAYAKIEPFKMAMVSAGKRTLTFFNKRIGLVFIIRDSFLRARDVAAAARDQFVPE